MTRPRTTRTRDDASRYRRFSVGEGRAAHPYLALIGLPAQETAAVLKKLEAGLPFSALERLRGTVGLALGELAGVLGIPPRTLARRRVEGRLSPAESDRLLRVSRVFGQAVDLYHGDVERAAQWLLSPLVALGGKRPIDRLATEVGARDVETILGRLEHGIFS